MRSIAVTAILLSTAALPGAAYAHHSFAEFDMQRAIGIVGVISEIRWRNPHVMMELTFQNPEGEIETWTLEMESVGMLRRMNVGPDVMKVGDRITVAGNPAADGSKKLYAQNFLLPNGQELVTRGAPRFSNQVVGDLAAWSIPTGSAAHPERGLFRVWSTTMVSLLTPVSGPDGATDPNELLTPEAQRMVAQFDPVAVSATIGCAHKGMPRIMQQPDDMAFEQDGENIRLRIEEYDTVRLIDMTPDSDRESKPLTTLGYSTGEWEDDSLIVTTTNIAVPETQWALPQSEQVRTVERFTPSVDGSRLDYRLTVTDPVYLTAPVHFEKYWVFLEDARIDPFDCVE